MADLRTTGGAEVNGEGRPSLPAGVYRHKESGQELVAVPTLKWGNPQADGYVRMGYEYVGPLTADAIQGKVNGTPGKIDLPEDPFAGPKVSTDPGVKSAGELEAELQAAKAREAEAARILAANGGSLADTSKNAPQSEQEQAEAQAKAANAPEKGAKK